MMKDKRFFVASIVLLVHLFSRAFAVGNASVKCIESERLSLLSLKQGFVDPNGFLSSWGNGENQTECCNWDGVQCDDQTGHVVQLSLYGLEGTITPSLAELHNLNSLDLIGNDFNLTQFPSFIFSLKKLEHLYLSSMNLKGKIPSQLGDLFHLQSLALSGSQLEGSRPKSLALCSLRYLELSNNSLSGQLDDFIASFSRCANASLESLDLSSNRFAGPLPKFSELSSLKFLYLAYNQFNGTLDDSIGLLSNLQELSIGHNSLQGVISETHFLRLSQLSVLDFSFNHLVFQISPDWTPPFHELVEIKLASCKLGPGFPMWLRNQKSGLVLDISNAEISGTIPSWFWNFSFDRLNLSHNQITGEIPNVRCWISNYIDFSSNLLEGSIPLNFSCSLTLDLSNNKFIDANSLLCPHTSSQLWGIDLSNNQLSGMLPNCWIHFHQLAVLNVANNSLSGKLPTSMGSLKVIQALHLGYNGFSGEIPLFLTKCTKLTSFDGTGNNFSGLIPSWIGDGFKNLRVLILRSNMLFGNLPSNICHLSQVQILDLSMNIISGSIPKCLNHLSALVNQTNADATIIYSMNTRGVPPEQLMDTASLVWKGRERRYQSTLGLVKSIDFSSNMLIGEIPNEVMVLVGLVSLNISRNKLSGQIPSAIGQLKLLDFLDLSRNLLSGKIPFELSEIDRLSVMDLSYNNLSREIPLGTQLQSFDSSTYVGNVELCGAPLPKCPTKPTHESQNDGNSEDDEPFFSRGFFISLSIGFTTGFWGVCSLIFLNKSWRYAYFRLLSDTYDKMYVVVAINVAKLHRGNRVST